MFYVIQLPQKIVFVQLIPGHRAMIKGKKQDYI